MIFTKRYLFCDSSPTQMEQQRLDNASSQGQKNRKKKSTTSSKFPGSLTFAFPDFDINRPGLKYESECTTA